jgi:hypothetical protein
MMRSRRAAATHHACRLQVAAGQCHTLFISDANRVYAAGSCEFGQFAPASSGLAATSSSAAAQSGNGAQQPPPASQSADGTPVDTRATHALPVRVHLPVLDGAAGAAPRAVLHEAKAGGHASVFLVRAPDDPVRRCVTSAAAIWTAIASSSRGTRDTVATLLALYSPTPSLQPLSSWARQSTGNRSIRATSLTPRRSRAGARAARVADGAPQERARARRGRGPRARRLQPRRRAQAPVPQADARVHQHGLRQRNRALRGVWPAQCAGVRGGPRRHDYEDPRVVPPGPSGARGVGRAARPARGAALLAFARFHWRILLCRAQRIARLQDAQLSQRLARTLAR